MSDQEPAAPRRQRPLGALLLGGVAAVAVFAAMLAAGIVLYQRVYGDSLQALVVIAAIFGGLGAYLAWLVGVLVFSVARRTRDDVEEIG